MKKDSHKQDFLSTRYRNLALKAGFVLLLILSISTVPVAASTITVTTETQSIFLGDSFTVSGINTQSDYVTLYIQGVNFALTPIVSQPVSVSADNTWRLTIDSFGITDAYERRLDVGTYTITAFASNASIPEDPHVFLTATTAIVFRQPFISIIDAPEFITQGTAADFVINAEASPNGILWYLFGTNYFKSGRVSTADDEDTPNKFTVNLAKEATSATNMAAGQYFAVFQHPMYDGLFNIGPQGSEIVLNVYDSYTSSDSVLLFNVLDRQTANAAQALCDALDSQNIDDMYVKYAFFVVGNDQAFSISEIPSEVTKGTQIVISGVDTASKGKTVQVEMISTAFAAVPKEDVNAAAFIVVTTEVADDGTWEVTLDTSDLNSDEYSVTVTCDGKIKKNVIVNVIDTTPTPVPTVEPTVVPTNPPVVPTPEPGIPNELQLLDKWNFISIPKTLDAANNTAEKVFDSVDTAGTAILTYNADTQQWEQITATTVIKPLNGYWLYANESATISLDYADIPVTPAIKILYKGWNAVGLSAGSATTAKSAFAGTEWRTVLPWNLEKGTWSKPLVNGGSNVNSAEQDLYLGSGSWLYVEADGTLVGLIA